MGKPDSSLTSEGYLLDFSCVKSALKAICQELDEAFLCPLLCPSLKITQLDASGSECPVTSGRTDETGGQLALEFLPTRAKFRCAQATGRTQTKLTSERSFPREDVVVLPIVQASAECLAQWVALRLAAALRESVDLAAVQEMTVGIVETPHQEARYTIRLDS
jgi:6-pyruvoyl-tetrahydropterin synthase